MKFNFPIVSHHVGGRAETLRLPILGDFEYDKISVLYEVYKTAFDQIQ